ncbi:MAG TPA: hypothetical protein PLB21_12450, partial [Actinomycetota bacterium]|nr:hypothetical protein [Actinomycetota bacterium]
GSVHMGLGLVEAVAADAISVDVLTCTQRWQQNTCAGRIETWVADRPLDAAFQPGTEPSGVREFGTTPAGTPSWIQVRATLDRDAPASATIRLRAWGSGDDVTVDSGGDTEALARTGPASPWTALWLGLASIGTGLLVTRLARVRRNAAEGAER